MSINFEGGVHQGRYMRKYSILLSELSTHDKHSSYIIVLKKNRNNIAISEVIPEFILLENSEWHMTQTLQIFSEYSRTKLAIFLWLWAS